MRMTLFKIRHKLRYFLTFFNKNKCVYLNENINKNCIVIKNMSYLYINDNDKQIVVKHICITCILTITIRVCFNTTICKRYIYNS